MHSPSPAAYAATLRWAHVPLAMFAVSIVWFVYFHFGAGKLWLAWAATGLRLVALALNFGTGVNINFSEVSALDPLVLWGGVIVTGPVGIANPLVIVPQTGNLLLAAFVIGASLTLWRRGGVDARRRAVVVGGGVVVCIAAVAGFAALTTLGLVHAPTIVMPGFFVIVLAMGYELGWDLIVAAQLASRLRASEMRFRAVVEAVPSAILLVDDKGSIALANAQAEGLFGYTRAALMAMPVDRLVPERWRGAHASLCALYATNPQTRAMGAGRELFASRRMAASSLWRLRSVQWPPTPAARAGFGGRHHGPSAAGKAAARQRDELAHLSRVAMLGELSGSLAHELNQPLAAILSNAQAAQRYLAQSPPRVDQLGDILSDIVKSDHRARAVIQRLRSCSGRNRLNIIGWTSTTWSRSRCA